jgi:hypothetical protein
VPVLTVLIMALVYVSIPYSSSRAPRSLHESSFSFASKQPAACSVVPGYGLGTLLIFNIVRYAAIAICNEYRPKLRDARIRPRLRKEARIQINERVRACYSAAMTEPVPDRHLEILRQFEASDGKDDC